MTKSQIFTYLYNTVIVLLLLAGITYVVLQFTHFGHIEYTDNARVCQYIAPQTCKNSKPAIPSSARLSTKGPSTKYQVTNLPPLCCIRLFEQRCHIDGENSCLLLLLIIFCGD